MTENIQFYQTPLRKELLIAKIRANQSLREIFKKKKNITPQINQEIEYRTRGLLENWQIIHIKGDTGTLKSSTAIELCKIIDPTFNPNRIQFEYEQFREAINQSQPKDTFQLDEQLFTHGTGTTRIINDLSNIIETLRKRQNSLILVSPELKYFPEEKFTYTLETIDDSITATCPNNQKPHEPRLCKCYMEKNCNIQHAHVRLAVMKEQIYLGFYIIKINWNNPVWKEYTKKKDEFMEAVRQSQIHHHDYKKVAEKIMNHKDYQHYQKNKKGLRILIEQIYPNLTTTENENITEMIRILQRQQDDFGDLEIL